MGHLWTIVQAHLDRYGVREAELARRIGTSPQTLNSWKNRGVNGLPSKTLLHNLAEVVGVPYVDVLTAALLDVGYLPKDGDGDDRDSRGAASMNAPGSLSDRRSKVTGTDLSGLPSVAHKRTKKRDDDD